MVINSASSMVLLERLSESMSSVAACFVSVLSVKRTLSCKTEDKTLHVYQPLGSLHGLSYLLPVPALDPSSQSLSILFVVLCAYNVI
jgi:hypothetical protein